MTPQPNQGERLATIEAELRAVRADNKRLQKEVDATNERLDQNDKTSRTTTVALVVAFISALGTVSAAGIALIGKGLS